MYWAYLFKRIKKSDPFAYRLWVRISTVWRGKRDWILRAGRASVRADLDVHRTSIQRRTFKSRTIDKKHQKRTSNGCPFLMVRETGLEPVRCEPHAPQTCASACSATLAFAVALATARLLYNKHTQKSILFFDFFKYFFISLFLQ